MTMVLYGILYRYGNLLNYNIIYSIYKDETFSISVDISHLVFLPCKGKQDAEEALERGTYVRIAWQKISTGKVSYCCL